MKLKRLPEKIISFIHLAIVRELNASKPKNDKNNCERGNERSKKKEICSRVYACQ